MVTKKEISSVKDRIERDKNFCIALNGIFAGLSLVFSIWLLVAGLTAKAFIFPVLTILLGAAVALPYNLANLFKAVVFLQVVQMIVMGLFLFPL